MKQSFFGYLFFTLFAFAGLACGAASAYMFYQRYRLMHSGEQATGKVIDLNYSRSKNSTTVAPVIAFTTRGGERVVYHSNIYTSVNPFEIGDETTLWYNPRDPQDVALEKSGLFPILITLLFCCTHGGVGFGGLIWMWRKRRLEQWLNEHGREVKALVTGIRHLPKGRYAVDCSWTDPYSRQTYTFSSEQLSYNPEGQFPPNALVGVLIDAEDPRRYRVVV